MAFPTENEIRDAIIQELRALGGQATRAVLFSKVAVRLMASNKNFTQADLQKTDPKTGSNSWMHRLDSVRSRMVKEQTPIFAPTAPRGIWRLLSPHVTTTHSPTVQQVPSAPPPAASPAPTPTVGLPPTPTPPVPPPLPPEVRKHEQLVETLIKVGRQLGKPADRGTREHDNIDVIWGYVPPWQPPTHIFEVQDKGVLHSALGKLQGAINKLPGLKPYLVLVSPEDKPTALKLVQQNYPTLQGRIRFVAGSTVEAIHAALEVGEDIKDLFS